MPSPDLSRRAVVTGLGAVTPIGNDAPTFWTNLLAGVPGGGPITTFDPSGYDVRIAAEVKGFDPTVAMDRKMVRRMSRFIHFAMAAATEAIQDSGLDFTTWSPEQRDRVGVAINTGGGGMEQVIEGTATLREKGPGQVSPFAIPALSGSMGAAQVSMKYGLTGPVITQVAACASGVIAEKSRPADATASFPAAIAKWMKRLIRRAIFGSIPTAGSKPLTSAAIRTSYPVGSKLAIGATPDTPARRFRQ